jgi:hypothetical protein
MGITRERHIEYAEAITKKQGQAGDEVRKVALAHVKKLMKLSRGNLNAFKMLLEKTRKQYVGTVTKSIITQQKEARMIGRKFQNAV